jgi:hypothetical protein
MGFHGGSPVVSGGEPEQVFWELFLQEITKIVIFDLI